MSKLYEVKHDIDKSISQSRYELGVALRDKLNQKLTEKNVQFREERVKTTYGDTLELVFESQNPNFRYATLEFLNESLFHVRTSVRDIIRTKTICDILDNLSNISFDKRIID